MEYAVVRLGGKQYKVKSGDKITVDKVDVQIQKSVDVTDVLLLVSGGDVKIGKPLVDTKIQMKVLEQKKGDKIRVAKFKAKSRYRKVIGFRPQLSVLEVGSLQNTKSKKS